MSVSRFMKIRPRDREPLFSFIGRVAASRHGQAPQFVPAMGVKWRDVLALDPDALSMVFPWLGLDSTEQSEMLSWTPVGGGELRRELRGQLFVHRAVINPAVRGCMACLREDLLDEVAVPPQAKLALRGHWSVREIDVCVTHRAPLVTLWLEEDPNKRYDSALKFSDLLPDIQNPNQALKPIRLSGYDTWIDKRLATGEDATWLRSEQLYPAATFIQLVGAALLRNDQSERDIRAQRAAGFSVVREGRSAIIARLVDLARGCVGPQQAYGKIYERFQRQYAADPDYDTFTEILREAIVRSWPVMSPKIILGTEVAPSETYTDRALEAVPLRHRRFAEALFTQGAAGGDIEYDGAQVRRSLENAERYVVATLFYDRLGVDANEARALKKSGVIAPRIEDSHLHQVWSLEDADALLERLSALSIGEIDPNVHGNWRPIVPSAHSLGLQADPLFPEIYAGRIPLRSVEAGPGLKKFYADPAICKARRRSDLMGASIFAREIGLRDTGGVIGLIIDGHTPAVSIREDKAGKVLCDLNTSDREAFRQKFVTQTTLAEEFGVHVNSARAIIDKSRVPVFAHKGRYYGRVWLRSELFRVLASEMEYPKLRR